MHNLFFTMHIWYAWLRFFSRYFSVFLFLSFVPEIFQFLWNRNERVYVRYLWRHVVIKQSTLKTINVSWRFLQLFVTFASEWSLEIIIFNNGDIQPLLKACEWLEWLEWVWFGFNFTYSVLNDNERFIWGHAWTRVSKSWGEAGCTNG